MRKRKAHPGVKRSSASIAVTRAGKTTLPNTPGRQAAQKKYNAKPEQKKRRAARGRSRYALEKKGLVKKGDGQDVDHKDGNPENSGEDNVRVMSKSKNRSHNFRSKKTKWK